MKLWIEVTRDKYRLIKDFDERPYLLARRSGVRLTTLYSCNKYHVLTGRDSRFMQIEIDDDEDEGESE